MPDLGLTPAELAVAFPFHFVVDRESRVIQIGASLAHLAPGLLHATAGEHLRSRRPPGPVSFELLRATGGRLCILELAPHGVTLRGQCMLRTEAAIFLGSPWVLSADELARHELTVAHYAVHDPISDLIEVLELRDLAITETRGLAGRLREQADLIRAANTELEHRLGELRRSAAVYRAVVDHLPDVVFQLDDELRWTYVNPTWSALTGQREADILGSPFVAALPEGARGGVLTAIEQIRGTESHTRTGFELDGVAGVREVDLFVHSLGERQGFTGMLVDRTAQAEAQRALVLARDQAEEAARAKAEFLANMSHEIRTPMNAVIGMTTLLLDTEMTDEQAGYVDTIRTSGESLLDLINDILDFSKIDARSLELEIAPFDVVAAIESAIDLISVAAGRRGLAVTYSLARDVPAAVIGDPTRFRQVLVNLLNNAVKFTERGEIVVDVISRPAEPGQCILDVAVRDTGVGIPPDRLHRLFRSFSQVDASTTRTFGGTGLGLAISKRLVEMMGGAIGVDSVPGAGSTFRFTVALGAKDPATPAWRGPRAGHHDRPVVVLDPAVERRARTRAMIAEWGAIPQVAQSVAEAISAARDLGERCTIVAALRDGELAELAPLAAHPELARLVLLAGAGRRTPGEIDLAGALGPDRFSAVTTPMRWSALAGALDRLFGVHGGEIVAHAEPSAGAAGGALRHLRILLAEDNPTNQRVAVGMLCRLGCLTDVVGNGREALEALARQPYDVALLDMQMPEMDGVTAARAICERFGAQRPRMVALTANATTHDRELCLAAGMDQFLTKPLRAKELERALHDIAVALPEPHRARARSVRILGPQPRATRATDEILRRLDEITRDAGGEVADAIAEAFAEDAGHHVDQISAGLAAGDLGNARRPAHALRGAASNIGAIRLAELAGQIEHASSTAEISGLLAELRAGVDAAGRVLSRRR